MMTISAVSFLATSRTKPIALMINQFEAQAQLEAAAVVSLAILLINLLVKALMEWNPKGIRG
jgi:iron(III) transport system permease protein